MTTNIPTNLADWDLVQYDSGVMLWRFEGPLSFELSRDPRRRLQWQLLDSAGYSYAHEDFAAMQGTLEWLRENV